jgi:hypothetical protein
MFKALLLAGLLSGVSGQAPYEPVQNYCPVQGLYFDAGTRYASSYQSPLAESYGLERDQWCDALGQSEEQEAQASRDQQARQLLGDDYLKSIELEEAADIQKIENLKKTYFEKMKLFLQLFGQMSAQSPNLRDQVLAPLIKKHSTELIDISKSHEQEKKELEERLALQGVRKKTIRMRLDHLNRLHRNTLMKLAREHVSDIYFALEEHFKGWEEENV